MVERGIRFANGPDDVREPAPSPAEEAEKIAELLSLTDPEDRSPRGHCATAGKCIDEINGWYLDNEPVLTVAGAVAEHRAAVAQDEASFTDDCKPICEARAARTEAVENAAFQTFVAVPCASIPDIAAKVDYLLNGTVGQRDRLLSCLTDDRYTPEMGCLAERFLRSLVIPTPEAGLSEPPTSGNHRPTSR